VYQQQEQQQQQQQQQDAENPFLDPPFSRITKKKKRDRSYTHSRTGDLPKIYL
jgi:hypothetical protein